MNLSAEQKEQIMAARGRSSIQATGVRKYEIYLNDGRMFVCIDLVKDDPELVKKGIREMFGKYGIKDIKA